ncbi:hypothetical protein IH785_08430 [candidate division KSB1 bacterium]|nr:hypothetical protein [candidate division KSB1 bacterium]
MPEVEEFLVVLDGELVGAISILFDTSDVQTTGPGGAALDHFSVTDGSGGNINTQTEGEAFTVRIEARDATNTTLAGFGGTVNLSVNLGTLTPTTSGGRGDRHERLRAREEH